MPTVDFISADIVCCHDPVSNENNVIILFFLIDLLCLFSIRKAHLDFNIQFEHWNIVLEIQYILTVTDFDVCNLGYLIGYVLGS